MLRACYDPVRSGKNAVCLTSFLVPSFFHYSSFLLLPPFVLVPLVLGYCRICPDVNEKVPSGLSNDLHMCTTKKEREKCMVQWCCTVWKEIPWPDWRGWFLLDKKGQRGCLLFHDFSFIILSIPTAVFHLLLHCYILCVTLFPFPHVMPPTGALGSK